MSSRRFELLLKFLHLNDSRKQPARGPPGYDKLYKVGEAEPDFIILKSNFSSLVSFSSTSFLKSSKRSYIVLVYVIKIAQ